MELDKIYKTTIFRHQTTERSRLWSLSKEKMITLAFCLEVLLGLWCRQEKSSQATEVSLYWANKDQNEGYWGNWDTRGEQLHREIALGFEVPSSLQSNITSKLHLCWVKLHETGQRTTEKRAITQKILETTQASAMFWFQPVSMESSNECPRNSVETQKDYILRT